MTATLSRPKADPDDVSIPAALTDAIAYSLRLAQEASFASYLARVGTPELKPGRYSILMILGENPGLTATEISRAIRRDKSTLTSTLRALQADGLVVRSAVAGDRRRSAFRLTKTGRALRDTLRAHACAHDAALERIVGADKRRLMAVLNRITQVLTEGDVQALPGTQDGR